MKRIRICPICQKPYRRGKMYKVEISEEIQHQRIGRQPSWVTLKRIVFICPKCNKIAGYKGRKEKK